MTHPLSERQQLKLLLQTTKPTTTKSALDTPISPTSYLTWSTARRRAWDRRHSSPNSYFFHYLHPSFSPRPPKWPIQEHQTFLAALLRAPPSEQWGIFSLLVPGRIGSDCRRYYHSIGRAGFIKIDGKVRNRLVCKAKIMDGKSVLQSSNPLFLRRSLRKFVPGNLPHIDDSLYKSIENPQLNKTAGASSGRHNHDPGKRKNLGNVRDTKPPRSLSSKSHCSGKSSSGSPAPSMSLEDAQELLTYVPAKPSEHHERLSLEHKPDKDHRVTIGIEKSVSVLCRLKIRDPSEKKKPRSRSSSFKSKVRSNGNTKIASHATSGRVKNGPVKPPSVAVKLRTKSPRSTSSSGTVSQLDVKTGPKLKEISKLKKSKKPNKTSKADKKAEKQNETPNLPQTSRASRGVTGGPTPRKANTAKRANALLDPRKQAETNVGTQPDVVGVPPLLDCSLPTSAETNLKRRSVKPLKPILKSQEGLKKRREKGKIVHFSPTEAQEKESPTQKQLLSEEDGIQGGKNRNVDTVIIVEGDMDHDQGIDPKIGKADDSSRCTQNCIASENSIPAAAACDSAIANDAIEPQADVTSSIGVSTILEKGCGSHLSGVERVLGKDASTSSGECKLRTQTPYSSKIAKHPHLGCVETTPAAEFDVSLNSDQPSGGILSTRKTTPEQLHVGSYAEDSEKQSFEDKSQKRVETIQTEQAASGTESQSTGTDGEFLDMEVGMDTSPGNHTELFENLEESAQPGTKLRNSRRVTGPTREDRTSIGFLMNAEDAEPHPKKRRVGTGESFIDNEVSGRFERAVSLINAGRDVLSRTEEEKEYRDSQEVVSVGNGAHSKIKSDYQLMQTRVEQTRLMLSLFVDMVDSIGERLGHKYQRRKLLASFDETFHGLQVTEAHAAKKRPFPISSLLQAANTTVMLDNRNTERKVMVHLGGLTYYWGSFVDSYIERVKEMEIRQKLELESKLIADSFC